MELSMELEVGKRWDIVHPQCRAVRQPKAAVPGLFAAHIVVLSSDIARKTTTRRTPLNVCLSSQKKATKHGHVY